MKLLLLIIFLLIIQRQVVKKYKENNLKYFKLNNYGIIGKSRNLGIKIQMPHG